MVTLSLNSDPVTGESHVLTQRTLFYAVEGALEGGNESSRLQNLAQCRETTRLADSGAEFRDPPAAPRAADGDSQELRTNFNVVASNARRGRRCAVWRPAAG